MESSEARERFAKADALYQEGRFGEALAMLDVLNIAFPGTRHIMFPRAMCLAALKRHEEAIALCNEIYQKFEYQRAIELKSAIEEQQTRNRSKTLRSFEFGDSPFHTTPSPVPQSLSLSWSRTTTIAATVLLAMAFLAGILYHFREDRPVKMTTSVQQVEDKPIVQFEPRPVPNQGISLATVRLAYQELPRMPFRMVLVILLNVVTIVFGLYAALSLCGKLPYATFRDNIPSIAATGIAAGALVFLPCVGWIAALLLLNRIFDLALADLLIIIAVNGLLGLAAQGLTLAIVML